MSAVVETGPQGSRLRVKYTTAPLVQRFIEDRTFITGLFGPLGCGKTSAGVIKAWLYGQSWPGARIAVIRDTWPNLRDTTQKTFFEWFPDVVAGHYHHTSRTFSLTTGGAPTEIIFRAMDDRKDIGNVLSLDLAAAWVDEPQGGLALRGEHIDHDPGLDHELFLSILARLGRQKGCPAMGWLTGNPPAPTHWIAKEFGYAGVGAPANRRPDYRLYLGDQDTNRHHLRAGYYEHLERLFGAGTPLARRFLHGDWIAFSQLQPFKAEWMRSWEERPRLEDLYIAIGVDPAISKKDAASRTAIVVVGQPRQGLHRTEIYVLKAIAGHWSAYESAEQLFRLIQEFRPRVLRIEDVAWQRALREIVEHEARVRAIALPSVDLVRPEGDKLRRAHQVSPLVESGRVLFGGPGAQDLVNALLSVPHDKAAWDLTDAFGLAVTDLPAALPPRSPLVPARSADPGRKRAASYAVKTVAQDPRTPIVTHQGPNPLWRSGISAGRRRAIGYAVKTGVRP